jgi:hypothetical protein
MSFPQLKMNPSTPAFSMMAAVEYALKSHNFLGQWDQPYLSKAGRVGRVQNGCEYVAERPKFWRMSS